MRRKKILIGTAVAVFILVFSFLVGGCELGLSDSAYSEDDGSSLSKTSKPPKPADSYDPILAEDAVAEIRGDSAFPLFAGKTKYAGEVVLSIVGENLLVRYEAADGFGINEVHLWVGKDMKDIPAAKKGNPKVGHFPFKAENLGGAAYHEITIPLAYLTEELSEDGTTFYAAAHAEVCRIDKKGKHGSKETEGAWAGTERIVPRGNWATWFSFTVALAAAPPPPNGDNTTTREAYAFGDRDLDNGGWSITVPVNVSGTPVSTVIYAMDGGAYSLAVGTVEYLYDGNQLTVGYILDEGYTLDETRIYIDEFSAPERDITADQLGNVNVQPPGTRTYTYGGFAASGDPIYLIAYAVVRGDFGE